MSNINLWSRRFYLDGDVLMWKNSFHKRFIDTPVHGKITPNGYIQISYVECGVRVYAYMHRVKLALHLGREPKEVDHIDRDRSNNAITNLREVDRSINHLNKSCGKLGRDLPKGVSFRKDRINNKCYVAQLKHNGKVVYKKHFYTVGEAEKAYNLAHKKLCSDLNYHQ